MKDQLEHTENSIVENSAPATREFAGHAPAGIELTERQPARRRSSATKRPGGQPAHATRPARPSKPVHHYESLVDEGDNDSFLGRHRAKIVAAVVVLLTGGAFYFLSKGKSTSAPKAPERIVNISLSLPPPPPPPPPPKIQPPPPKPDDTMVKAQAPDEKPPEAPKPAEAPKEALGTNNKGPGPGLAGLGSSGNGGGVFGGTGSGGGTQLGFFASQLQKKVASALRNNPRTKKATLNVQVRIWSDSTGRITRVKLDGSTGDSALDDVIQNQVLTNLQLDQPPPVGARMPVVMRLSARRP